MNRIAFITSIRNFTRSGVGTARFALFFEPKIATNKVREDTVHFIVGFEHERPAADRHWKFTRWDLVDLSHFQVKLKAEFQGSNHDMYRPEAIVATSVK